MQLQENPMSEYLRGPQRKVLKPRPRGRPVKETPEHYARLLRGHAQIVNWFLDEMGRAHRSDAELYEVFRKHVFASGDYARQEDAEMVDDLLAVRLKTALNALGRARRFFRNSPEKWPFTGMDHNTHSGSNHHQEIGD